jgi:hypothetical protein
VPTRIQRLPKSPIRYLTPFLLQAPSGFEYFDYSICRSWKSNGTGREDCSPNFFARCKDDLLNTMEAATQWIDEQSEEPSKADSNSADTSHEIY